MINCIVKVLQFFIYLFIQHGFAHSSIFPTTRIHQDTVLDIVSDHPIRVYCQQHELFSLVGDSRQNRMF